MRASSDPDRHPRVETKSAFARYVLALAVAVSALLVTLALFSGETRPLYAPLIGAAAIAAWYGGLGPSLVVIVVGWAGALAFLIKPVGSMPPGGGQETLRWGVGLVIALVVVAISEILRRARERAVTEAGEAVAVSHRLQLLSELSGALAASATSADVERLLTTRGSALVRADGAAVGLVQGAHLVLQQSWGIASEFAADLVEIPLEAQTLGTRAVREGRVIQVRDGATLQSLFPLTAERLPAARSAIAAPLRAAGAVVGSLGFLFVREDALDEETVALVSTMAGLAEQALERASLYDDERARAQALDRILRMTPQFRTETLDDLPNAICREARETFAADFGVLWRVRDGELVVLGTDPPAGAALDEAPRPIDDFPGLARAVSEQTTSFVPDVLVEAHGRGLALVRALGVRSSLRTPISIRGGTERVLSLWWKDVVDEPDRSTLAIVRRFADQAGLALEEAERRRAQAEAAKRTGELGRMFALTAALSNALTRTDVAAAVIEQVADAVRADAASVSALVGEPPVLRLLAARGYPATVVERWEEVAPDERNVLTGALHRQESVFRTRDELERVAGEATPVPEGYASFLFVPLVVGRRANGVVTLSWKAPTEVDAETRRYVESLVRQAAQALDRAEHFESERTIAETLQRSVLPGSLPRVDGIQLAARYLPGTADLDVGGDWFDAMQLPDGRLGLVVGDVVGKGVYAAASMGQLRNALRAFSVDRLKPASALARLDRLAGEVLDATFATLVYVSLDPATGVCRLASAGHPPPLLVHADGRVEFLEGGRGLPLGTGLESGYQQQVVTLPAGALLLLYSDGLVERPDRSLDDGLRMLGEASAAAPSAPDAFLETVVDHMLGEGQRRDDVAVLAARFLPVAPRTLDLRVPSGSLDIVRDALRVWLDGAPLERSDKEDLVLAAWEACANASEHPVDPHDGTVRVRASLDRSEVTIVVEDSGRWRSPSESPGRGLGLALMRSAATSVDVDAREGGTRVTIAKAIAVRLEEPDEQQDDDDEKQNASADVHATSFPRLPS